jgi:hypothetical protein
MKRLFGTALLIVAALGTIAIALPVPNAVACYYCTAIRCPPCTHLGGGSCFKCPTCQPIAGCTP